MESIVGNMEAYLGGSMFMALVASFLGGVVVSFTPCVYPMIPITAGYVCSSNVGGSRGRALVLSISYVVGVAVIYASLGIFASLTGRFFGSVSTSPVAYIIVANVIIISGLAMLDVFSIPVFAPGGSRGVKGPLGAFIIGGASGFVAAPCTAPVLGVLLAYVATKQSVVFGGLLMFVFSLGLGTLLVLVGTFSGVIGSLPKSGEWMVRVKKVMGLLMIVVGEYFLVKAGGMML
jgi:thiol:disulfide interchange protein DsbD